MLLKHLSHVPIVHKTLHLGESWTHALYCGVLFVEGHGLYAVVGGILGIFVVLNMVITGDV